MSIDEIHERMTLMVQGKLATKTRLRFDRDGILVKEVSEYDSSAAEKSLKQHFDNGGELKHDALWDYVYAIQMCLPNSNEGPIKIGKTNNIDQRLKELRVANPYPLRIIAAKKSKFSRRLEADLHKGFSAQRLRGEWFDLSSEQTQTLLHELNT